jgi:hypothetical protein
VTEIADCALALHFAQQIRPLPILTAIRPTSDLILIKVPIGQPCLKERRPFSLTTDLTVMADAKLQYVISDERPIGFILSCASGWKSYDQDGQPIGLFDSEEPAVKAVYEHADAARKANPGG